VLRLYWHSEAEVEIKEVAHTMVTCSTKYKDIHCPSLYSIATTATLTTNAKRVLATASMNAILKQNQ